MDAFDADALIDAAVPDHVLGRRVRAFFPEGPTATSGAVALHGAWDGALFANDFSGEDAPVAPSAIYFVAIIASLIALWQILRERPDAEPLQ